jgi:hypothetical protein
MGSGTYSSDVYRKTVGKAVSSGRSMAYSSAIKNGEVPEKAHDLLDPMFVNKAGLKIRECFDSDEHPDVTPIIVSFDLTGSNADVAMLSQDKLRLLYGMLTRRGICSDPAVCVAGYGDTYCDKVPLQISQFEANNAIDEALDNMYLECGGGGNDGETSTLLWYFVNKHIRTDACDKRGKKGYFFMIADECALDLRQAHIEKFIGEEADALLLTAKANADKLQEHWNVFILQVDNSSAREQNAPKKYVELFGREHVLPLDKPENMIETIATAIGVIEETLTASDAAKVLKESGASDDAISTAVVAVSGLFGAMTKAGSTSVSASVPDLRLGS